MRGAKVQCEGSESPRDEARRWSSILGLSHHRTAPSHFRTLAPSHRTEAFSASSTLGKGNHDDETNISRRQATPGRARIRRRPGAGARHERERRGAQRGEPGEGNRGQGGGPAGRGRANYSLNDPAPNDPALKGAIDMHAHQDPDSFGPSYGQAARSIDALDLYTRAKASGMRGFIIKGHLDQTAGLAYYLRKLHPDMEIFGGMGRTSRPAPRSTRGRSRTWPR